MYEPYNWKIWHCVSIFTAGKSRLLILNWKKYNLGLKPCPFESFGKGGDTQHNANLLFFLLFKVHELRPQPVNRDEWAMDSL